MKKFMLGILIIAAVLPAAAQEKTLFSGEIESGWCGGPFIKIGSLMDETGFLIGGQGGWIINHRLKLGGKGYILMNPVEVEGLENVVAGFGCGGALLEYIIASDELVHGSLECMIGAGGVYNDVRDYTDRYDRIEYTGDGCFVVEPGLNMILNVTRYFRIGTGVTYRWVNGVDYEAGAPYVQREYKRITDSDLSGISLQITFSFGKF